MLFFKKLAVYFIFFIPAAVLAAVYGMVHDQISFTVSPEYFTHFKFIQFDLPWAYRSPRLGAAWVGFLASWWMGILIFAPLGLFGFLFSSPSKMALALMKAFFIVIAMVLLVGLVGLAYGYVSLNESNIVEYSGFITEDVLHPVQFMRVGLMHSASYFGGGLGLVAGVIYLFRLRNVEK